jgi:8-oxo-dGTP diphosphatase
LANINQTPPYKTLKRLFPCFLPVTLSHVIATQEQLLTGASAQERMYPARPYVAVSAAVFRNGRVLIVRRAQPPAAGLYTLPGGVVELGETLAEAAVREVWEETGLDIEPLVLVGYREVVARDVNGRVERHFVILPFAARWRAGEITLNEELAEARWLTPSELSGLRTTEGLAEIVGKAWEKINASS